MTKNGHNDQNIHSTQNNINVAPMLPPSEARLILWIHSIVFISSDWWLEIIIKFLSQHLEWWLILIWSGGENVFGHWWLWVWWTREYSRDWIKYQFKHSIMETKNVRDYFDKKWILTTDILFETIEKTTHLLMPFYLACSVCRTNAIALSNYFGIIDFCNVLMSIFSSSIKNI